MPDKIIYHICKQLNWENSINVYEADSLAGERFIHCSTKEQVIKVANVIFKGQKNLILLFIDTEKVKMKIRYENLEGGETLFPHIYGVLNTDAVIKVVDFPSSGDGYFHPPEGFFRLS